MSFKSQKALYFVRDTELKIACVHVLLFKKIYKALKVLTEIHSSESAKQKHEALAQSCFTICKNIKVRLLFRDDTIQRTSTITGLFQFVYARQKVIRAELTFSALPGACQMQAD